MLNRAGRRRPRDETGNIFIAVTIVMVLTTLALAGAARAVSVLSASRATQEYSANLAWADSAVADVLYRLDQGDLGAAPNWTLTRRTSRFFYTATPDQTAYQPADRYTVMAAGIGAGPRWPHGVRATIIRHRSFAYGLYTVADLDLSQGAVATVHGMTDAYGYVPAIIGSSGTVSLPAGNNNTGGGDGQDYGVACNNCYTSSRFRHPDAQKLNPVDRPTTAPPVMPSSAPVSCTFSGAIAPGVYNCSGDAAFTGTVPNVAAPGVSLYIPAGHSVLLNQHSVNYSGACSTAGDASKLQIYMAGGSGSTISIGSAGTACVAAIIYAPSTTFIPDGQGMTFTGSMILYAATGNGDPSGFNFYYDRATSSITRNWTTQSYQEVPASAVPNVP